MVRRLMKFGRDRSGSVAVIGALAMPVLLGVVGIAVDYSVATHDHAALQRASDTTAMALAKELTLARPDQQKISSLAQIMASQQLTASKLANGITVVASVTDQDSRVRVSISRPRRQMVAAFSQTQADLSVRSVASVSGQRRICLIALDPSASQALYLKSNSLLSADRCDLHSNSVSAGGVSSDSGIRVVASRTCSAGGFSGAGAFTGEKATDCPAVRDPLSERPVVPAGACSANNERLVDVGRSTSPHTIGPGTYCGGLFIGGNSVVQFRPGVYVIKDGPFTVDSNADVRGAYVGFMLTGKGARYQFLSNAKVWFDAPRDGSLAGILFYEDPSSEAGRLHEIKSNFVSNLTGTVYLPRGKFVVDATNDVSQRSAFTIIVAKQIELTANPRLFLNTNYSLTDVPVPSGLGQVGGPVRLIE